MIFLDRFQGEAYALLRIVTGFLFCFHGLQKIFGVLSTHPVPTIGSQIWFGGLIELIGGLAVMVGFQTRLAAFLCSGTMAVAYFQFHWQFRSGTAMLPIVNEGEMAALYCFVFLFIATRGSGRYSLDRGL